jgi:hypothetical protein
MRRLSGGTKKVPAWKKNKKPIPGAPVEMEEDQVYISFIMYFMY